MIRRLFHRAEGYQVRKVASLLAEPLSRNVEMEILPACEAYGMGLVAYEPLAEGVLAGAFHKAGEGYRSTERVREIGERHRTVLGAYERLCQESGEPPAAVALAWLLS